MSAEHVVMDTLMQTVSRVTAEFLLSTLREQWEREGGAVGVDKQNCKHWSWRFVNGEPGIITRCDICGEANV